MEIIFSIFLVYFACTHVTFELYLVTCFYIFQMLYKRYIVGQFTSLKGH